MDYIKRTVSIFGSTGSIGVNAVKLILEQIDKFKIKALISYSNVDLLAQQALALKAEYVCIVSKDKTERLKELLSGSSIKIVEDMNELAKLEVDILLMAIVGSSAISPTINAIKAKNKIALANKECLVCAGNIITDLAKKNQVKLIPVDSEHSGLFQVFDYDKALSVKSITLTASGGAFRDFSYEQMENVTKQQALKHPNWLMGEKITIDCATLVNKCLEVIEAYHLFPISYDQIKIIIHPQSTIHALVNYVDGSVLAQLGVPNMQIPISYALYYPNRANLDEFNHFDLSDIGSLNFYKPDYIKFRSLSLLEGVLAAADKNAPLIFNIANEVAVDAFLKDKIKFIEITQIIEEMLAQNEEKPLNDLQDVLSNIEVVKAKTLEYINKNRG